MIDQNIDAKEKGGIASVVKAIRIMDCFDAQHKVLGLAELSKMTGYPKTTVYGIVATLVNENMVTRVAGSQNYALGTHLLKLAYHTKLSMSIVQLAAPTMNRLCAESRENVYLTTHSQGRLLYLESCFRDREHVGYSETGKSLPMHCTASGKAMLSYMTEEQVDAILSRYPLTKVTSNTITDATLLRREFAEIRARGFAIDDEEETVGVKCIAVPVLNQDSMPVGAISISGSVASMTTGKIYEFYEMILNQLPILRLNASQFPCQYLV